MNTGARFSVDRLHRYRLWRRWDDNLPHATFLMMNPSTADEVKNDPTVARCQQRANNWLVSGWLNVGGVEVVNVFAWRETDSKLLPVRIKEGVDIIGPDNDAAIIEACKGAAIVVCAWGGPGHFLLNRGPAVLKLLRLHGIKPYAFKINADGSPKHPLYIGYADIPSPWTAA